MRSRLECSLGAAGVGLLVMAGVVAAQPQTWPSERPPGALAARQVKFPDYELHSLANGLKVVVVPHHREPAVSLRLVIRSGSASDPPAKLGLAHLAASLLDQGTTTQSAQQLNDAIDFIGGELETGATTDLIYLNLVVLKDSFGLALSTLSEMARHPAFTPGDIERQRQQLLSGLEVNLDDPEFVADAVFDRLVYGSHPYGMPQTGTPQTVTAITRDDLVGFHTRHFVPNNAILAIVGDVTAPEAFAAVTKVFADWAPRPMTPERFLRPPPPTRRVIVVDKPDAVQTEVRVGQIGVPRKINDYMAVNLAMRILGGEGSNRLHQVLRTERALTYGAQAELDTLKDSGDFEAQTNTRSAATAEVVGLIVDEFRRLDRERVGDRELDDAKAYLAGSFPLSIETPDAIALQVLNQLVYDLPLDELQEFRERVNAVTAEDIERAAHTYLRPNQLSVVLVGNAKAFVSQLKEVGLGTFETVELSDLDLLAPDFRRPSPVSGHAREPVSGTPDRIAGAAAGPPHENRAEIPAVRLRALVQPGAGMFQPPVVVRHP